MRFLPNKRSKVIAAVAATIVLASTALVLGVADSASPPESGPKVDTHVGHSYIYTVDVASGQLTQETNHQGEGALEPILVRPGRDRLQHDGLRRVLLDARRGGPRCPRRHRDEDRHERRAPVPAVMGTGRQDRVATVALGRGIYAVDTQDGTSQAAHDRRRRTRRRTGLRSDSWIAFHRQVQRKQLRHLRRQRRDGRGAPAHERLQAADEPHVVTPTAAGWHSPSSGPTGSGRSSR